jgi:hypothetical protein
LFGFVWFCCWNRWLLGKLLAAIMVIGVFVQIYNYKQSGVNIPKHYWLHVLLLLSALYIVTNTFKSPLINQYEVTNDNTDSYSRPNSDDTDSYSLQN